MPNSPIQRRKRRLIFGLIAVPDDAQQHKWVGIKTLAIGLDAP
jgi:hypothetical protein